MSLGPSQPDRALDSPGSQAYDESFAEGPSFLSDMPSATSDDAISEPDSLADASPAEVEARAVAFLNEAQTSSGVINQLNKLSTNSLQQAGGLDPFNLPRKQPTTDQAKHEAHKDALAFLRRCLAAVDDTSWQYYTPPPFDPPHALGPKARTEETDGLRARDEDWPDSAFNLASYPTPPGAEPNERLVEPGVDEGEWDAEDGKVPKRVDMEQSGMGFGDSGVDGFEVGRFERGGYDGGGEARLGEATSWGARSSLVRRVSELGMK